MRTERRNSPANIGRRRFPARRWFAFLLAATTVTAALTAWANPKTEFIKTPDGTFLRGQKSTGNRLVLGPDECFFPTRGCRLGGTGKQPDPEKLNGGRSFAWIHNWAPGHQAEWGLWLGRTGSLRLRLTTSGATPATFTVRVNDRKQRISLPANDATLLFDDLKSGHHLVTVELVAGGGPDTRLHHVEADGSAAHDALLLRKRWRPAAAHTRFSSSAVPDRVRLWVMEMDAVPGTHDFYAPITTPFGYYGPTWLADGRVNTGFNFSLWSYGRGQQEPPVEKLSHLLAVGDPAARFDGFGHEGTGVKIRGWEPLRGRQGQRQALALRVEPGATHNTFHSYFYAADEQRWRLFGVGRKLAGRRPLESLWVGSFVEVPGPPDRQRTGPYVRRMRYRGWVMDADGKWGRLDRMSTGNVDRETGLTHTFRGVDAAGWFQLQTGGWEYRVPPTGKFIELPAGSDSSTKAKPEYLQPDRLAPLLTTPAAIEGVNATRTGGTLQVRCRIRSSAAENSVTVYFGTREGLTFAKRWSDSQTFSSLPPGKNTLTLRNAPDGPLKVRLLLQTPAGKFWSFATLTEN